MKRINQRQAVEAIRNKEEFKAGALSGGWVSSYPEGYVVRSYSTVIATHIEDELWLCDDKKYSVTTSRHQSIVRQAIGEV
jgi:hypothetical protein